MSRIAVQHDRDASVHEARSGHLSVIVQQLASPWMGGGQLCDINHAVAVVSPVAVIAAVSICHAVLVLPYPGTLRYCFYPVEAQSLHFEEMANPLIVAALRRLLLANLAFYVVNPCDSETDC